VLLGPTLLGRIAPDAAAALFGGSPGVTLARDALTRLGLLFFLFAVGLETDLSLLRRFRRQALCLGLSGSLLHVWNHAFFKALLFLSAGSVIHANHTREIDLLGGLAKGMPWTAVSFLVGSVAISGLPPLNGFVSEFLIYLGLFKTLAKSNGPSFTFAAFAAPVLALIGALALACFVKVFGAIFLGVPRSLRARTAHESPPIMLAPLAVLVSFCFVIGLAPILFGTILAKGVSAWAPGLESPSSRLTTLAPLDSITIMSIGLTVCLVLTSALLWMRLQRTVVAIGATWGCGYVAPTSRMQYTSSSFAQMLVGLFSWVLRPRAHRPMELTFFPSKTDFHSEVPDTVLDEAVLPTFRFAGWLFSCFRVIQQGSIQTYLLYIFVVLIVLLLWR
jgi:hydrogenase-4 component B